MHKYIYLYYILYFACLLLSFVVYIPGQPHKTGAESSGASAPTIKHITLCSPIKGLKPTGISLYEGTTHPVLL